MNRSSETWANTNAYYYRVKFDSVQGGLSKMSWILRIFAFNKNIWKQNTPMWITGKNQSVLFSTADLCFYKPLVLQNVEPDFPPRAAHWTHLVSDLTNPSSPVGKTISLRAANCSIKNTRQKKLELESENCTWKIIFSLINVVIFWKHTKKIALILIF